MVVLVCDDPPQADKARSFLLGMNIQSENIEIVSAKNFTYDGATYNSDQGEARLYPGKIIVIGYE